LRASLVQSNCAVGRNPDKPSSPLKPAVKKFCLLLQKVSARRGTSDKQTSPLKPAVKKIPFAAQAKNKLLR